MDELARSPPDIILFLLFGHFSKNRQQETFKLDIIVIGNKQVSNSTMPVESVFDIIHVELSHMEGAQAFHDVFLDSTSRSDDAIDHLMLGQITNDISHSAGGHV